MLIDLDVSYGRRLCLGRLLLHVSALWAALILTLYAAPASAQMSPEMQKCLLPQQDDLNWAKQIASCEKLYEDTTRSAEERAEAIAMIGELHQARFTSISSFIPDRGNPVELDKAMAAFDQALKLQPEYPWHYLRRANAWRLKGDLDRAIADYGQQIRFNPERQEAYRERGDACRAKGDLACAIADYSQQIKLVPFLAEAYMRRGQAYYLSGDHANAIKDFERANRAVNGFAMIWLYLARTHSGGDGRAELEANAKRLRSEDWPFQLVDFFLGRRPPSKILTGMAVRRLDSNHPYLRCPMQYFLGEWHLLRKEHEKAKAAFRGATAADCPRRRYVNPVLQGVNDPVETDAAALQLRRMK